ncbi:uncharacterized protein LOC131874250 [Cryptomeria japonica]|uniref:uncharacterized protein LOC131874250 n=1 Tax=Cryptomeria japonica TaxID=3369 RepID=UPI0027DA486F|nr:uncharacterized protein LOC131874250 [Cryptomeria japonica]
MEDKVKSLEDGKEAMKNLMGVILSFLSAVVKNLEDIAKVCDQTFSPKPIVELDLDEETIQTGSGDATLVGGTAKRTKASVKKAMASSANNLPNLRDNIKELHEISNTLEKKVTKIVEDILVEEGHPHEKVRVSRAARDASEKVKKQKTTPALVKVKVTGSSDTSMKTPPAKVEPSSSSAKGKGVLRKKQKPQIEYVVVSLVQSETESVADIPKALKKGEFAKDTQDVADQLVLDSVEVKHVEVNDKSVEAKVDVPSDGIGAQEAPKEDKSDQVEAEKEEEEKHEELDKGKGKEKIGVGNYFHQEDEFEDMCKNKEVEELAEVMGTLEKNLEERKRRLERMEGELAQSDSGENEGVSKLYAPEKEKDSEEENRLIVALNAEIDERMAEHVSFDASTREKVKKKVQGLLVTHEEITKELKSEFDEFQQIVQYGVPSLVDDAGVIKDRTVWISECKSMLSVAQAITRVDVLDMNDMTNQLENFYVIENAAKDAIFNATTYKDLGYLRHIKKCGRRLGRKS